MLKICRRLSPLKQVAVGIAFPFFERDVDSVNESKTLKKMMEEHREKETGWDRLYLMFSVDETGQISPEIQTVQQSAFMGLFGGAMYGGFVSSRIAYINFMEHNKATSFNSLFEAKRKLQDHVTISFAKGAFRWGWRAGLFCGSYVLISSSIAVYRGKSSVVEYPVAGAVTGALYKFNMGLRGMMVGGLLGTALGGIAGVFTLLLLKATGTTMEEVRFWQYEWDVRSQAWHYGMKKSFNQNEEVDPLLASHDEHVKATKSDTILPGPAPKPVVKE